MFKSLPTDPWKCVAHDQCKWRRNIWADTEVHASGAQRSAVSVEHSETTLNQALHSTQNQSRIFHPEGLYKKMIMMTTHQIFFSACQGFLGCSEVMEGIAQICLTSSL